MSNAPVDEYFSGCVVNGSLAHSVADVAAFLDAIAGYELGDAYWLDHPETSFLAFSTQIPTQLRIGFATHIPDIGECDIETKAAVLETAKTLESLGHIVEPVDFGDFDFGDLIEPFFIAWQTQTDVGIPGPLLDRINRELWFRAQFYRAGKYIKARQKLYQFGRRVVTLFQPYDVVLLPTLMTPAIKVGECKRLRLDSLLDRITKWFAPCPAFNASGQPAIALPFGISQSGIPLSIQLVGRPADEKTILQLATQLEIAQPFTNRSSGYL